ncbi:DBP [Pigeon adenovirus 2a]|nr:DBP [Pigeon adenovirus 2a]
MSMYLDSEAMSNGEESETLVSETEMESEEEQTRPTLPPTPPKRRQKDQETEAQRRDLSSEEDGSSFTKPLVFNAQKAMGMMEKICEFLDIKWQGADIQPDNAIWNKIGGTFIRKKHPEYRPTFSTFDSLYSQFGRFVAAMVYAHSDLDPKFIPGGCHIWLHRWFEHDGADNSPPRCMHGEEMIFKPRTIEMNPSSESGKRALAEQNGVLEKNRAGRTVVVLRFDHNVVCFKDVNNNAFNTPHAHGSCGMSFSDAMKAVSAMKHDIEWTAAIYPKANADLVRERVLICSSCSCNYATEGPIQGRQLCRMIPYKIAGASDITKDMSKGRPDMQAHKAYPHTMVFSCCNPQSLQGGQGRNKMKTEKTCSWKISAMDLRYAYVFANELAFAVFGRYLPTNIPEFRWNEGYAFKTDVLNPVHPVDTADPFA